jgi:hypothetical protein
MLASLLRLIGDIVPWADRIGVQANRADPLTVLVAGPL